MQQSQLTSNRRAATTCVAVVLVLSLASKLIAADPVWVRRSGFEQLRQGNATDGGRGDDLSDIAPVAQDTSVSASPRQSCFRKPKQ